MARLEKEETFHLLFPFLPLFFPFLPLLFLASSFSFPCTAFIRSVLAFSCLSSPLCLPVSCFLPNASPSSSSSSSTFRAVCLLFWSLARLFACPCPSPLVCAASCFNRVAITTLTLVDCIERYRSVTKIETVEFSRVEWSSQLVRGFVRGRPG